MIIPGAICPRNVHLKVRELRVRNLFKNKRGFGIVEALIAIFIFIIPVTASLTSVVVFYRNTHSRQMESIARNLSEYLIEDLRMREFYRDPTEDDFVKSLCLNGFFYEFSGDSSHYIPPGEERDVKWGTHSLTISVNDTEEGVYIQYDPDNSSLDERYNKVTSDNELFDFTVASDLSLYTNFRFVYFIKREPVNPSEDDKPQTKYTVRLRVIWNDGRRERFLEKIIVVAYHEP